MRGVVTGIEHFLNLTPAHVSCDLCRGLFDAHIGRWPPKGQRAGLIVALREDGWIVDGDHEHHVCPRCVGELFPARVDPMSSALQNRQQ